ncbi:Gfo/Idh/MocA family protein [Longirhabdus pacifica]|uniref:Gfo/Idh/MocA family protein n=1 Tax=Longirhabdus pacifica TaxID=2305227 RepID=UPI001008D994|nr:Gfo/Idh/MocA family oxidoreductase [Longirhabdus pacifica]
MNFAIIGCGFIGKKHAEHLAKVKGCSLVAVSDIYEDKMEEVMQAYKKQYEHISNQHHHIEIKQVKQYRSLLDDKEVEVIIVATSTGFHEKIAHLALSHGKHVICEKPLALSLSEATKLISLAKKKNLYFGVCYQKRYLSHLNEVKQIIANGHLGHIINCQMHLYYNRNDEYYRKSDWRGTWEQDGGVMLNQAIHNIDMVTWLVESTPTSVLGKIEKRKRKIEAEDTAFSIVQLEPNIPFYFYATVCSAPHAMHESISILGTSGRIQLSGKFLNHVDVWDVQASLPRCNTVHSPMIMLYEDVIQSIHNKQPSKIDADTTLSSLHIIFGTYMSAKKQKKITLPLKHFQLHDMKSFTFS